MSRRLPRLLLEVLAVALFAAGVAVDVWRRSRGRHRDRRAGPVGRSRPPALPMRVVDPRRGRGHRTVVAVRDRRVVASTALERDAAGGDGGPRTVEDAFAGVADRQSNADDVEGDYHPELGYPTRADVDLARAAIDDEHGVTVTDLEPR